MGLDMYLMKVKKGEKETSLNSVEVGYWRKYYELANISYEVCCLNEEDSNSDDFIVTKENLKEIIERLKNQEIDEFDKPKLEYTEKLFEELENFDFENYYLTMSLSY